MIHQNLSHMIIIEVGALSPQAFLVARQWSKASYHHASSSNLFIAPLARLLRCWVGAAIKFHWRKLSRIAYCMYETCLGYSVQYWQRMIAGHGALIDSVIESWLDWCIHDCRWWRQCGWLLSRIYLHTPASTSQHHSTCMNCARTQHR